MKGGHNMIRIDTRDSATDELLRALLRKLNVPAFADITVCSPENIPETCDSLTVLVCNEDVPECDIHGDNVYFITRPISFSAFADLITSRVLTTGKSQADHAFSFDAESGSVEYGTEKAVLTPKEAELFAYLLKASPNPVSREELRRALWKDTENTNAPDVYVSYLRRKLRPLFGDGVIVNERGAGYILKNIT